MSVFSQFPREHYVDGGFRNNLSIEQATKKGVTIFSPIPTRYSGRSQKKPEDILPGDGPGVKAWKERMVSQRAKEKYKQRAATIEWANALARNRGLYRLLVRGVRKGRAVLLWYALAHNLMQSMNLRLKSQALTTYWLVALQGSVTSLKKFLSSGWDIDFFTTFQDDIFKMRSNKA